MQNRCILINVALARWFSHQNNTRVLAHRRKFIVAVTAKSIYIYIQKTQSHRFWCQGYLAATAAEAAGYCVYPS